jgi:hypothetical protein
MHIIYKKRNRVSETSSSRIFLKHLLFLPFFSLLQSPSPSPVSNGGASVWGTFPPLPAPTTTAFSGPDYSNSTSSEQITSDTTIPAVMVGVASVVIFCSVLLYIADLRDRCRHERMLEEGQHQRRRETESNKHMETIASSGYWVSITDAAGHSTPQDSRHMLPSPIMKDRSDFAEDISISHMSTMTSSLVDGRGPLRHLDSDGDLIVPGLESLAFITELSDNHRVSQDTELSSLVDLSQIQTMTPFDDDDDDPSRAPTTFTHEEAEDDHSRGRDDDSTLDAVDECDEEDEDESGWSSPGRSSECSSRSSSIGTFLSSLASSTRCRSPTGKASSKYGTHCRTFTTSTSSCSSPQSGSPSSKKSSSSSSAETPHRCTSSTRCTSPTSTASSSCSSTGTGTSQLFGERCLEVTPQKVAKDDTISFELSPDTPGDTNGNSPMCMLNEMEQFKIPYQEYSKSETDYNDEDELAQTVDEDGTMAHSFDDLDDMTQDYVREIYFVPIDAIEASNLGIELDSASCPATHPTVAMVTNKSPLKGRVFVGDILLAVNNLETAGLCGAEVTKRFFEGGVQEEESQQAQIVKLTIMSSQSDGSSDSASSSGSIDTGRSETALEV